MKDHSILIHFFVFFILLLSTASTATEPQLPFTTTTTTSSSIVFATVGRSKYEFDIFTLPITNSQQPINQIHDEVQLTDGISVNYNGFFPSPTSSSDSSSVLQVVYVTERYGSSNIYRDTLYVDDAAGEFKRRRLALDIIGARLQIPLLHPEEINGQISMKDRPSISGEFLVYISTHENPGKPRKSWTAVYSTHLKTRETRRLTPVGVADFSPSVSPSGTWTAVASSGEKGWNGEIEGLNTDIYIFKTRDGSDRVKVVEHGGWPCWMDEFTIFFHRESSDGWWSVYQASLPRQKLGTPQAELIVIKRVTPPGLHAFTPAASIGNKTIIAVATRRPTSDFRHIELYDLSTNNFVELTRPISAETHHYNPFISPDGSQVGYHKCRGSANGLLLLENINNLDSESSLFRIDGDFPSFSPDGDRIAYVGLPGLYVVNRDGSGKRQILSNNAFSTAWDWKRKGVLYTSIGPIFATEKTHVDIVSINIDEPDSNYKELTTGGQNNAFPSASPDGRQVVFRSGRSGHKNLYIMDAINGEKGGLKRLTSGPWTDTMCNWSPGGEWIAFASDRDNPGSGSFGIYFIHPNGTGVRRVFHSGEGGRANHPWFSPDSMSLVFTSDYAGVSAEPISNPHHFQPYGDIFVASSDGSGVRRLTHNSYEDGTPTWSPARMKDVDVTEMSDSGSSCAFEDCYWLGRTPKDGVVASPKLGCA